MSGSSNSPAPHEAFCLDEPQAALQCPFEIALANPCREPQRIVLPSPDNRDRALGICHRDFQRRWPVWNMRMPGGDEHCDFDRHGREALEHGTRGVGHLRTGTLVFQSCRVIIDAFENSILKMHPVRFIGHGPLMDTADPQDQFTSHVLDIRGRLIKRTSRRLALGHDDCEARQEPGDNVLLHELIENGGRGRAEDRQVRILDMVLVFDFGSMFAGFAVPLVGIVVAGIDGQEQAAELRHVLRVVQFGQHFPEFVDVQGCAVAGPRRQNLHESLGREVIGAQAALHGAALRVPGEALARGFARRRAVADDERI